jgi:hypothetical protein
MAEKLDFTKLEQWHTTVALMGANIDEIFEWGDEDNFIELLEAHEEHLSRIKEPNSIMRAVMLTNEMDVSVNEIEKYFEHLSHIRNEELEKEREERIRTTPAIASLVEQHDFRFVTSKQYPKHKHFVFKDKKGLEIRGRAFNHAWGKVKVWLTWKDSKNKVQRMLYNLSYNNKDVYYPKGFPSDWTDNGYYTYSINPDRVAYIIAHRVVERKLEPKSVYPKA